LLHAARHAVDIAQREHSGSRLVVRLVVAANASWVRRDWEWRKDNEKRRVNANPVFSMKTGLLLMPLLRRTSAT